MLLIVLSRVLVQMLSTLFWLTLLLGLTCDYVWSMSTQ